MPYLYNTRMFILVTCLEWSRRRHVDGRWALGRRDGTLLMMDPKWFQRGYFFMDNRRSLAPYHRADGISGAGKRVYPSMSHVCQSFTLLLSDMILYDMTV